MSDDDWFERALRDDADDREAESGDEDVDPETDHGEAEPSGAGSGIVDAADDSRTGADDRDDDAEWKGAFETDRDDDEREDASETDRGNDAERRQSDRGDDETDDGPFEEDFASALQNAPDPEREAEPNAGGPSGSSDRSGNRTRGEPPFGGGEQGGGEGGGGPPFDSGAAPSGGGDGFGFGDFGGSEPESFDEDSFESDLDRLKIGIEGLDEMILGGVPRRSLMVAIGSAGTGKTTFGLQFLNHGLQQGEDAVYITLEESRDRIISTASEKGWTFEEYAENDRLAVIDIDPIEMANSLDSIQNDLPNLIREFGADRLVLDSVSLLEMMYESPPKRRSQVFGFARALKNAGITILLTSEASQEHPYASRFGIVEYLADAVFVLQYVRPSNFRETRLAIEIQKIRDANHSRETKPYDLTESGISVYRQANIF